MMMIIKQRKVKVRHRDVNRRSWEKVKVDLDTKLVRARVLVF